MPNDDETPAEDLEALASAWSGAASEVNRVTTNAGAKIIQAVRELLTSFPMPGESVRSTPTATTGTDNALPSVEELTQSPSGLTQYQSLAMLAGIVRWFSRESGRSEEEILEGLAANYR